MQTHDQICRQLVTLRDYIRWGASCFKRADVYFGHGTDNALDESLYLVLHCLGLSHGSEVNLLDARLTHTERIAVLELIERRINERMPLPYLTGEAWFAGLPFTVDARVLIPRSPIAELIRQGFEPWLAQQPVHAILDLCTGSGCIGISCAHYFAEAEVDLADISAAALEVAAHNIKRHELGHRVRTIASDVFSALGDRRYQLIVSNPPYVDSEDLASMPAEYHHEPAMALGSGQDGLDITRIILREASRYLSVEVGNSALALEQAYPQVPFTWLEFERGGHGVFVFSRAELLAHEAAWH